MAEVKRITKEQLCAMELFFHGETGTTEQERRLEALFAEVRRLRTILVSMDKACEAACNVQEGGKIQFLSHAAPSFFAETRTIREEEGS